MLSIQIPTTYDRKPQDERLMLEFLRQAQLMYPESPEIGFIHDVEDCGGFRIEDIEVMYYRDNKEISIGEKRDRMYKMSTGQYSWQVDSDDWISENGLQLVMLALKTNPDCVTFMEKVTIDGRKYKSNHSIKYPDWEGEGNGIFEDGFNFHRTPFFKDVIRTDYCVHIGVSDSRFGEDHEFARLIKPMLLKEVHIDEEIYFYQHVSTPFNERYGIR